MGVQEEWEWDAEQPRRSVGLARRPKVWLMAAAQQESSLQHTLISTLSLSVGLRKV